MTRDREEKWTLEAIGISALEERAYRVLLERHGATLQEIAEVLALPQRRTQRLLDSVEVMGLATHSPERPRRYLPMTPDIAIEALILKRQDDLRRVKAVAQELQENAAHAQRHYNREQIVEVIASREVEMQVYKQLHNSAQHKIRALVRPPMLIVPADEPDESSLAALARGVSYITIADNEFLSLPGAVGRIQSNVKAGEQVRIFPHLPLKMILADSNIAIVPLNISLPRSPSLLVRSSALLNALCAYFEMLWEQSAPIAFSSAGAPAFDQPKSSLSSEDFEQLLPLLAAGLNDKTSASELGISVRTLERRILELMEGLGARTRFQAGWLAALRLKP
jgi:sugar-specific transcriptional regulator TrmB